MRLGGCCGATRGVGAGGTQCPGVTGVGVEIVERVMGLKWAVAGVESKCRLTCMRSAGSRSKVGPVGALRRGVR